jgi:SusD/RagB-like outer membrane lipoprotein
MNAHSRTGIVLALALLGAACSDFLSGPGLTENPNNPTVSTATQQLIAMQSNMATRLEGQIARCAGIFTQQLIGSNNQQFSYCTQYGVTELDITGQMSGFYTGGGLVAMRNIQASGDPVLAGIAKIWEGLAFGTATSVWGDLPYSETLDLSILTPRLDPQEDIYTEVQLRLDEGIASLQGVIAAMPDTTVNCVPAEGDLIYCAAAVRKLLELQRWIRAANTLKARFHLHLVERNGNAEYTAAIAAANLGVNEVPASAADGMHGRGPGDFRTFHGTIQDFDANIWAEFLASRQDIVAGNALVSIMKARNDTIRLAAYFDRNATGQIIGSDQNNVAVPPTSAPSVINSAVRRVFTFRQPIVTWAENQLILAEAKFQTGDSAGAVVHVNNVRGTVGLPLLAGASFTDIMLEKYIAMYQNIDVWSDYKRTCIPTLTPYTGFTEVLGRLPYGSAERTANPNLPLPASYPAQTTGASAMRNWNDPNACP